MPRSWSVGRSVSLPVGELLVQLFYRRARTTSSERVHKITNGVLLTLLKILKILNIDKEISDIFPYRISKKVLEEFMKYIEKSIYALT
jgi:hypothetical protein